MIIQDLKQPEMLELIESRLENQKLKLHWLSPIRIFNFNWLKDDIRRECSVSLDEEWIIRGIAVYRYRWFLERWFAPRDYAFFLIWVDKDLKWRWTWTQLLDHVLKRMKTRTRTVTLQIHPQDISYRERWTHFLHRKFAEHNLILRDTFF
jgi:ribosomal protein S18 acetylase RimI-like enzyme